MARKPPTEREPDGPPPINLRVNVEAPQPPGGQTAPARRTHPLPEPEVCNRLVAALEQAALDSSHSMEALRLAVCDFTAALRQQGTTPEAVLISLKSVVNQRVPRVVPEPFYHDRPNPAIHEKMTTWSIQEFFRGMAES